MEDSLQLSGPHWSFAVELYQRPGVADACIWLQDTLRVDVNILLFTLFAASERGLQLGESEIAALDRVVLPWRSNVILELRRIRRRLKAGPPPAPSAVTEALRNSIKNAELRAEQIEQAVLARWLDENATRTVRGAVDPEEVLTRVVAFFADERKSGSTGELHQTTSQALNTIRHQLRLMAWRRNDSADPAS